MNINEYKDVYVFIETRDSLVQNIGLELLGKGREIADITKSKLVAILLGSGVAKQANSLIAYGADVVYVVDNPFLKEYLTEQYSQALYQIIAEKKPNIFLIGATSVGRDLAPRLSSRMYTGLTADCTKLEVTPEGSLFMTRPAFGGNLMATIICPEHRPQMSTVRPGVMKKLAEDKTRKGEVIPFDVKFDESKFKVEVIEVKKDAAKIEKIEEAKMLVSCGRGVGKANFGKLCELAGVLNATVSGSRAVVDAGWIEQPRQVGQTGKTVRPGVYMALGISGAIQHLAGMEESDFIIAVNKDKTAPIFKVADLGIVCDVSKLFPLLIDEVNKLKNAK